METKPCASFWQCRANLRRMARKFAKQVQPIYEAMGWQWDGLGIPTVDDIEFKLGTWCNEDYEPAIPYLQGSGRLVVRIDVDNSAEFIGSMYIDP